jgi:glycosyltransferase involved in cell wall biosynthesis
VLSIIIPCYNVQNWIKTCVESILKQSYKNIEIICIDDCSNDKTPEILQELSSKYQNIKLYKNSKNQKIGWCRNFGIEKAVGEFITFIDADDLLIEINFFNDAIRIFTEDHNVDFVCAKSVIWENNDNFLYENVSNITIKPMNEQNMPTNLTQDDVKKYLLNKKISWIIWAKIYRKSLFKNIKFVESEFWHWQGCDCLTYPQLVLQANKIVFYDKYVYLYNNHPNSDSYNKDIYNYPPNKDWENALKIWWKNLFDNLYKENKLTIAYRNLIIDFISHKYKNTILANEEYINNNFIIPYDVK